MPIHPRAAAILGCVLSTAAFSGLGAGAAWAGLRADGIATPREMRKAEGPSLVTIQDISKQGLRRSDFYLPRATEVVVRSVGYTRDDGESFRASGWILDLGTRRPVWSLLEADGEETRGENWSAAETIELPPGAYSAYYATYGETVDIEQIIEKWIPWFPSGKVKLIDPHNLRSNSGPYRRWDSEGNPQEWGLWVSAVERGFVHAPFPSARPEPFPDAVVRLVSLKDNERRRVRLVVDRPVSFSVWATGEYADGQDDFVDGAWILRLDDGRRVFALDMEDTEEAGGHYRNRLFEGPLRLEAGRYQVTVVSDDSHAFESWNSAPPWDPESWGFAMSLSDAADRDVVHVEAVAGDGTPAVALVRVQDNETRCQSFEVARSTRVLVRALGEATKPSQYADFGWIEDRMTFETVWEMDRAPSLPAGGAAKNREVESIVTLPAGSYNVCYATDDSHAYSDWNQTAPAEPENWGIRLFEIDADTRGSIVVGAKREGPAVISAAPVGSHEHVTRTFSSDGETRVQIIAIGEGDEDELADSGWIENLDTGKIVWDMEREKSTWAGGAKKNREVRTIITLPPGRYALHFETDDSHAFGDWNAAPPRQPHLWGVTLIELP